VQTTINIQVGDRTLTATKAHLKLWLQLSDTYEKFLQACEESSYLMMAEAIYEYLDIALGGIFNWHEAAWFDTVSSFTSLATMNVPNVNIPLMAQKPEKKLDEMPWDYPHRSWYAWAHILAKAYGWTMEYIAEMEIEDALCMLQEIQTQDQLEKEFDWARSEIAYPYNPGTKKAEFKALPRPNWMLPTQKEIKKVMIPRSMLPMGVVENLSGMFAGSVVKNDT
jgi:hypothetical protein